MTLLRVEGLVKQFHGHRVVDDVGFGVHAGEVVALLGQNGAGKSTVIKILAGVCERDQGRILLGGRDLDRPGVRSEISFVHQELGLVEWMTVAENIAMTTGFPRRAGMISWRKVRADAECALALVGGGIDPDTRVFDLPRTERSLLAIARGLMGAPKVLVLDEPSASLPAEDTARLFEVVRQLQADGVGIIYVSHRLDEIYAIADSVVVLRDGRVVGDGSISQYPTGELVRLIVGREAVTAEPGPVGETVTLELDDVRVGDVGPVSLRLSEGEIVGLVGLRGAGQNEVGRAVAGIHAIAGGRMSLTGAPFRPSGPAAAVRAGIGFTTSDRESDGVASGLSVRENLFLNPSVWGRRACVPARRRKERERALALVHDFGVRPADQEAVTDTLSGGNQQKVMLARWFGAGRSVVVLEEPTMGVDAGAKADIYGVLRQASALGTAALVVSTDLEEVAALCHRVLVFERGQVRTELAGSRLTVAALTAAVAGL